MWSSVGVARVSAVAPAVIEGTPGKTRISRDRKVAPGPNAVEGAAAAATTLEPPWRSHATPADVSEKLAKCSK
jgi:hypothetical protein